MPQIHCRYFSGYKPCGKNAECNASCPSRSIPDQRILIISLEALGAVLRSTVVLEPLKKRHPKSHITWVTEAPAHHLLTNNPAIDRVLTLNFESVLTLEALEFDVTYVVDKSLKAAGLLKKVKTNKIFGFRSDARSGAILPATPAALELWGLGLSNQKKFFENTKAETQLLIEALELGPFDRPEYSLHLTANERAEVQKRRSLWSHNGQKYLLGINTGASAVIPYKKFSLNFQREIVAALQSHPHIQVVLLGGRDEAELNKSIARGFAAVVESPVDQGLRDGILSVAACDFILSGDSLGMHLGIALKKWVVAWFGPTCAQEIDLYDRGQKLLAEAPCSPCWKRLCDRNPMCYDQVPINRVLAAIEEGLRCQTLLSKPHFSETFSSASHSFEP